MEKYAVFKYDMQGLVFVKEIKKPEIEKFNRNGLLIANITNWQKKDWDNAISMFKGRRGKVKQKRKQLTKPEKNLLTSKQTSASQMWDINLVPKEERGQIEEWLRTSQLARIRSLLQKYGVIVCGGCANNKRLIEWCDYWISEGML